MFELLSPWTFLSILLPCILFYATPRWFAFKKLVREYGVIPGPRYFAYSIGLLSYRSHPPRLTPPRNFNFLAKHKVYEKYGWDIISNITVWPSPRASLWIADPDAVKEITSARSKFVKPVAMYRLLRFYGGNIVASEGDDWKRHRKTAQPAFSEQNNKLVWDESIRIVNDMIKSWAVGEAMAIDHVVDITRPIALLIIGSAGFGHRVSWAEDFALPMGHVMSFRTALTIVCKDIFLKVIIPRWASGLTQRYRDLFTAFDELKLYMEEMITERQNSSTSEAHHDLFSNLIKASGEESHERYRLTSEELMGDTFVFLLAGHETSAHTLAFAFALLALYPDEQERLFQEIRSLMKDGRLPKYEEMSLLARSTAVFYETLRLYPPVNVIPKICTEDTTLSCNPADSSMGMKHEKHELKRSIPVVKNARVMIHIPGLHYNPRFWEDPESFKPDRFLREWPREAFLPFSGGPRACIGRRFFETEGIATLSAIISQYKIEITQDSRFAGESWEATKERVLACKPGLTLTPVQMPLTFRRRA